MKKTPQFIWFLLATIALVGIIFMLWPKEEKSVRLREKRNIKISEAVVSFVRWAEGVSPEEMDIHHGHSRDGLLKLAEVLSVMVESKPRSTRNNLQPDLRIIRQQAESLAIEPKSSKHTDMIKDAFQRSSAVLEKLQIQSYPGLNNQIDTLNKKVATLNVNRPALEQKEQIQEIFQYLSKLLKLMTGT